MMPPPPPQAMKARAQNSRLRASNPPQRQPNGGHEKFSRRNTYKGPPPTREDFNARRNTYADEPSETLMVLTKKDGNNRGSPDRRPSAADLDRSVRSARSDGFLPIQVDTDNTKTGRQSMYKRSNSADNLPAMIAMSRQSSRESQPREKRQSTLGARLSDSVIGQDQNGYDDVLMDLFSSVVASSRENLAFGVAPSLGKSNNSGMKNSRSNAEFDLIRPNRNSFHINSNLEYNPQRIRRGSSTADLVMKSSSLSPSTGKNFNDMLKGSRSTDQLALLASTRKPVYNNNNMEYNPPSGINVIDKSKRSRSSDQLTLMSSTRKPGYNNNNPETNPQKMRRGSKPSDLLGNPTNQPEMTRSRASSNWLQVLAAIPDHAPAPPLSKQVDQADQKLPRKNSDNRNPGLPRNNSDMMLFQMATQIKGPNEGEGKQTEQNDRPKNRHLKNENNKLKLYDEILSASDPKIGKWIGGPTTQEGTQSTMPSEADPSFLAGSMNKGSRGKGGQSNEMRESRRSRCSPCGQYKQFFIVGLFLLLVGLGIGGYFIFFSASNETSSSSSVSEKDDGDINTTTRSTTTTTTPTPTTESTTRTTNEAHYSSKPNEGTVMDPPPSDIEARCSASNLPGSLSACLAACLPSACCYADFTGGSCSDNTACSLYRPYCDVFYDAWIGGTEGVLKDPTDEIVTTCIGTTSANSSKTMPSSHNSSALELSGSSFTVNRLRGHGSRVTSKDAANDNTRNLFDSTVEACQQYCITAKCCSASIVTDPEAFGLVRSPTGVFTNSSSGEYVMTNCQVTNTKNVPLCAEYQAFCSTRDVTESVPSPNSAGSDLSNVKPSTKPMGPPSSLLPSITDVTDSMPSLSNPSPSNSNLSSSISKKPTQDAGNETISTDDSSLISSGTTNATTGGNPSPSQTTVSFSTSRPSSYTQSPNAAPTESFPFVPIPAASAQNIQEACASDRATFLIATGDPTARSKCIQACQDGLCCFTDELGYDWMESCYEGNQRLCLEYSACLVLKGVDLQQSVDDNSTETDAHDSNSTVSNENSTTRVDDTDSTEFNSTIDFNDNTTSSGPENPTTGNETESVQVDGPPLPAKDLDLLCSEDSISRPDGLNECIQACRPGKCCGVDDEEGCYKTHAETCILYFPCNSAYNMLNSG